MINGTEPIIPSEIEIIFCIDACSNGWIVDGAKQWLDVDMLDGCGFNDNCIVLPKDINSGVYKGRLRYISSVSRSFEGTEYDMEIILSDIKEYLSEHTLHSFENKGQYINRLEKRIEELEPEENFISVSGNDRFGGEHLEIRKVNETTIHLKVGHCCVYSIDTELPCEAFTGLLTNLINESNGLTNLIKNNSPWGEKETEYIISKL